MAVHQRSTSVSVLPFSPTGKEWQGFAVRVSQEWADTYEGFLDSGVPLLILHYEELEDPGALRSQLLKISNFLHVPIKSSVFECVVRRSQEFQLKVSAEGQDQLLKVKCSDPSATSECQVEPVKTIFTDNSKSFSVRVSQYPAGQVQSARDPMPISNSRSRLKSGSGSGSQPTAVLGQGQCSVSQRSVLSLSSRVSVPEFFLSVPASCAEGRCAALQPAATRRSGPSDSSRESRARAGARDT